MKIKELEEVCVFVKFCCKLGKNVTGDATWVYGYDVETKMQSSQWMGKGLLEHKKKKKHGCEIAGFILLATETYTAG